MQRLIILTRVVTVLIERYLIRFPASSSATEESKYLVCEFRPVMTSGKVFDAEVARTNPVAPTFDVERGGVPYLICVGVGHPPPSSMTM